MPGRGPQPVKRPPVFQGRTIKIRLTKGKVAIIDYADRDLAYYNWSTETGERTSYAVRRGPRPRQEVIRLHRLIAARKGIAPEEEVDHHDRDGLNDRRANLRAANSSQQKCNAGRRSDNTSGVKGVYWIPRLRRWAAYASLAGKRYWFGKHKSKAAAARARAKGARALHGQFRSEQ